MKFTRSVLPLSATRKWFFAVGYAVLPMLFDLVLYRKKEFRREACREINDRRSFSKLFF